MDAMTIGFTRSSNNNPISLTNNINQQTHISRRSYWGENTGSHLNSEVKHSKAGLVLGWGTAWEPHGNDGFFSFAVSRLFPLTAAGTEPQRGPRDAWGAQLRRAL